jgi:NADH-quinone oxidoreductase subunit N
MFLAASATDLLMLYLSIELLSLGSYVLAGFSRYENRANEAAIKYIIFGGLSTGAMLFGMTYLYGLTGSTSLIAIRETLQAGASSPLVFFVSFLLIMVGMGYKIASVPFHFWAPDVYQGAPSAVTAFLSVASKGAGFAAFIRIFYTSFLSVDANGVWSPVVDLDWTVFLAILAMVSMTFGNFGAFWQNNVKRMFAYSSIAHAGYILVGAIALTTAGLQSILFYLLAYLFTNLAAFTVIVVMADRNGIEEIDGYNDLGRRAPWMALCMGVALFSLVGVPPMAGFIGKWFLFAAAMSTENPWCVAAVVVGLLNSVVSVFYYFRIFKAMYLVKSTENPPPVAIDPIMTGVLSVMAVPIIVITLFGGQVYDWTGRLTQIFLR